MKGFFSIIISVIVLVLMALLLYYSGGIETGTEKVEDVEIIEPDKTETNIDNEILSTNIPLTNWFERITKKPFGILIVPETSPVQPEKFSGYHTGTDFEVIENEIESEVEVLAICDGEVVESKYVSGYGGVLIQSCEIYDKKILVLYGHIDLSIPKSRTSSKNIKKGEIVSILADDQSYSSGGERKHLHLGIIRGTTINYKGYVESESSLSNWLDFQKVI